MVPFYMIFQGIVMKEICLILIIYIFSIQFSKISIKLFQLYIQPIAHKKYCLILYSMLLISILIFIFATIAYYYIIKYNKLYIYIWFIYI